MKKTLSIILSAVLILALLCGCGASGGKSAASYPSAAYSDNAAKASSGSSGGTGWMSEAAYDMPVEAPAMEPTAQSDGKESGNGTTGSNLPANVKLIYRANIDMESTEFDAALQGLNELVTKLGGYFENSELNNYAKYRNGYYTVRVPAENFETFCASVGELCQVNSISRSAEDVSERYYDLESRLVTQQTKLARLQDLLKQAEDMEDIITLESAISETELTIETLTGSLRKYDSLVGYATINISLAEVYKLTEVEQPAIGFGAKLAEAFRSGSKRFANGFQNFLLSVARGWIGWLIFLIIVAAVVLIVLKIRNRRRAARAAAPRPSYPPQQVQPLQQPPQNPQGPQNPQP